MQHADLFAAASPTTSKISRLSVVARRLSQQLGTGAPITRQDLGRLMTDEFDGSDAQGLWSMRDAYDALEVAQAMAVRNRNSPAVLATARATIAHLEGIAAILPTQTYRSEDQIARQQFSTPAPIAFLAACACFATQADIILEPSAGTGMLAAWLPQGARLLLNEIDDQRAGLLADLFAAPVTRYDAEHIDDHLDPAIRPSVVLMNPPFSRSESRGEDRHAGARHLRAALVRLAEGGRCVAIMPAWFSPTRSGSDGYAAVTRIVAPKLDILIRGSAFAKHGTSIDVRLLVFDKVGTSIQTDRRAADTAEEVLLALQGLDRAKPSTAAAVVRRPALPIRNPGTGGLLGGIRTGRPLTPAPARVDVDQTAIPLAYNTLAEPRPAEQPVGIYVPYRLARVDIPGASPHATALVESIAMASIVPPLPTYLPKLPPRAAAALSDAQLETVIYAGQAFNRDLPGMYRPNDAGTLLEAHDEGNHYRQGYFLGDGTGAGKGRQVAGVILDQWSQGHRKAIWISKATTLLEDARRDWTALGGVAVDIQPIDGFPLGSAIGMSSGILFMTYATLRSQRHDAASRLKQIVDWLGRDHEGMIVFDEAHCMANAAGTETKFGTQKGSEQGLAGVRLQNLMPRARVLYVSATGATDIANLCYASRLGLWGAGTAFATRETFMTEMTEGGIAAMELVARDLKAQGLYAARALSFAGVEYEMLEHALTPDQIQVYDAYADAWQVLWRAAHKIAYREEAVMRRSAA